MPRTAGKYQKLQEARQASPLEPSDRTWPKNIDFRAWTPELCETIKFCCLKPTVCDTAAYVRKTQEPTGRSCQLFKYGAT